METSTRTLREESDRSKRGEIMGRKKEHTQSARGPRLERRGGCLAFRRAGRVQVELQAIIGGLPVGPEEFRTASKGNMIYRREGLLRL